MGRESQSRLALGCICREPSLGNDGIGEKKRERERERERKGKKRERGRKGKEGKGKE